MPRAKREKLISLTTTKKKTKESKQNLVARIREALETYERLYVFEFDSISSSDFIKLRHRLKDTSQFFVGKKTVMGLALGRTKEEESEKDLHAVSQCLLSGQKRGLLFTNMKQASVTKKKEELRVNLLGYWTKKKGYHEI